MNASFSSLLLNSDLLLSLFSTLLLLYLFFTLLLLSRFFQITSSFSLLQDMDSTNPYSHQNSSFVDLLSSQQEPFRYEGLSQLTVFNSQSTATSSFSEDTPTERKERKKWTPTEDVVLISSWLNTSKDPVVGNEQKAGAFWKRIAAYYAASSKVVNDEKREAIQCKERWQKINDFFSKLCGSYEAATRQKTSGQNDGDVVKLAHEIFYNDHKIKFNLHHAWEELCNDHKWYELATTKLDGSSKKRRCEDGAQSENSQGTINLDDPPTKRHVGVKAAKGGSSKRSMEDGKALSEFQTMWSLKEKDLPGKERLSKMGLLDRLIAKTQPLSEEEEALKKKLITKMLANQCSMLKTGLYVSYYVSCSYFVSCSCFVSCVSCLCILCDDVL